MNYLVIKTYGNGYSCSCCRSTWTSTDEMEFENDESAIAWAKEINDKFDYGDNDCQIDCIYQIGACIYG